MLLLGIKIFRISHSNWTSNVYVEELTLTVREVATTPPRLPLLLLLLLPPHRRSIFHLKASAFHLNHVTSSNKQRYPSLTHQFDIFLVTIVFSSPLSLFLTPVGKLNQLISSSLSVESSSLWFTPKIPRFHRKSTFHLSFSLSTNSSKKFAALTA